MIKLRHIGSLSELTNFANRLPAHFVFRGQADAKWNLASSLERILGSKWNSETVQKFERFALDEFRSRYHLYRTCDEIPRSTLEWLSIMQHHGVPTRMLDFTQSPYVALYFALESSAAGTHADVALFALDFRAMMKKSIAMIKKHDPAFDHTPFTASRDQDEIFDSCILEKDLPIAWITEPGRMNARLDRQMGCFLVSGQPSAKLHQAVTSKFYQDVRIEKVIVPARLRRDLHRLLVKLNITGKSIYGDLEGMSKAIRMELQSRAL
jgi:hypothetical protein